MISAQENKAFVQAVSEPGFLTPSPYSFCDHKPQTGSYDTEGANEQRVISGPVVIGGAFWSGLVAVVGFLT